MAFFPRTRAGGERAGVLEDLVEYHRDNPGITEATLGALRTADGLTGYQLLAARVPVGAHTVVDLGCGNGPLLRELHQPRVIGVDACASELALAASHARHAELLQVTGQAFGDRLEVASVDAVLSHHAFYLMEPIEPVVASIARVLRPHGLFAFVTSSPRGAEYEPWSSMMRAFSAITKREHPTFGGWGDRRVWTLDGLHELLDERFEGLVVEEFVLVARESPEALCDRLLRFLYSAELQSEAARAETRGAWLALLARPGDALEVQLPYAIVSATRRAAMR